jgi:O-antigen/teichoic acid export membrane protein
MFAPEILKLWMGKTFAGSAVLVFEILSLAFVINSVAQLPFTVLQAVGRTDLTGKVHLIELPIHLLFTFIMVRELGLVGTAVATLCRILLDACLLYFLAFSKLGLEVVVVKDFGKKFLIPILILLCGGGLTFVFQQIVLVKVIVGIVSLLSYALVTFVFSLEANEKQAVTNLILRKENL